MRPPLHAQVTVHQIRPASTRRISLPSDASVFHPLVPGCLPHILLARGLPRPRLRFARQCAVRDPRAVARLADEFVELGAVQGEGSQHRYLLDSLWLVPSKPTERAARCSFGLPLVTLSLVILAIAVAILDH